MLCRSASETRPTSSSFSAAAGKRGASLEASRSPKSIVEIVWNAPHSEAQPHPVCGGGGESGAICLNQGGLWRGAGISTARVPRSRVLIGVLGQRIRVAMSRKVAARQAEVAECWPGFDSHR